MSNVRASMRRRAAVAIVVLVGLASARESLGADEPVDLGALLAEAESNHPELKALAARREAATQVPSQTEALPDPLLSASYTNEGLDSFTLGSAPRSSLAFTWTQDLPYPGKRRLAGEVAQGEITTAERRLEAARVRIRSQVKRSYFDLYRIDRTTEILEETRTVFSSLVASARSRYESGEGTLENVLKAQTQLTAIEADLATNREDRRATEARLAAAVGRSSATAFGPVGGLPAAVMPDRSELEARALTQAPELRVLDAAVDTEARRLELARKSLKPDLMYGAAYANRGGLDPIVMGTFGVRLPLYRSRKQAQAVAQTESQLEAARREVDRGQIEIIARVRALFAQFDRASALAPLYSDGLIPQARSTLDAAAGTYTAGKTEFLALQDDALAVLRYEIEYERQRVDALQAMTDLEELTGVELIPPATGGLHD
jgi:cobalt-zinc-cadmium efflux system outer membrane protein